MTMMMSAVRLSSTLTPGRTPGRSAIHWLSRPTSAVLLQQQQQQQQNRFMSSSVITLSDMDATEKFTQLNHKSVRIIITQNCWLLLLSEDFSVFSFEQHDFEPYPILLVPLASEHLRYCTLLQFGT
jgi:hypothetical protein